MGVGGSFENLDDVWDGGDKCHIEVSGGAICSFLVALRLRIILSKSVGLLPICWFFCGEEYNPGAVLRLRLDLGENRLPKVFLVFGSAT